MAVTRWLMRARNSRVHTIKEILLPGLPCKNLLSRLVFALAGKIAPAEMMAEPFPEQDIAIYDYQMYVVHHLFFWYPPYSFLYPCLLSTYYSPGCTACFNSGWACSGRGKKTGGLL
jgi:hypothetical protein